MPLSVALIEELIENTKGIRRTLAVCANSDVAEAWIKKSGGNQTVLLANGDTEPLYRISEFVIMCRPTDFDPIEF